MKHKRISNFRNNVSDGWLVGHALRMWRNFARNWDRDIENNDFFDIFEDPMYSSASEAKEMMESHFTLSKLDEVGAIRVKKNAAGSVSSYEFNGGVCRAIEFVWNETELRTECRRMLLDWCGRIEKRKTAKKTRRKDLMELHMDEISRMLTLSPVERDIVVYAAVRAFTCFDDFPIFGRRVKGCAPMLIAMAIDVPVSDVKSALYSAGRLRSYNVLDENGDFCGDNNAYREHLVSGKGKCLEGHFYKRVDMTDVLPLDYYGKLSETHGDVLKELIVSARGTRGANILLYGAPGTGKTSFAKTLAKELGMSLFEIRQGDKENKNDTPQSRMTGIRICNEQVPRGRSMVMVDEADQLLRTSSSCSPMFFGKGSDRASEKGVINSILDEIKLPTVWICNAPADEMDDSVRRRFDYSICFEMLNSKQRQRVWQNNVKKLRLGKMVTQQMIETLADKYPTNAGGISMVLENVKRMKPRKNKVGSLIDKLMAPHCELMGGGKKNERMQPSKDYSLEGVNIHGDIALKDVVEAVKKFRTEKDAGDDPDCPRMNLLLWGPPGTGKTEFVMYLGQETGAKVMVKKGSDLLSMWVGGTEKKINRMFAEAEAENAILFLDEFDGLVQERSGANRSWEVTQVNELLHQMENFKGVMVGATNFFENLDQAIMRRFTFKLQFDYLDEAGKRLFFERMFKTKLTEEDLEKLKDVRNLAPGDFRTVRQSMYYLGGSVTNAQRIAALAKESEVKRDTKKAGRIGFGG